MSMKMFLSPLNILNILPHNFFEALLIEIKEKRDFNTRMDENISRFENEVELIQKQGRDKAEKLKRAECQVKRLLKKIGAQDISNYNVINNNIFFFPLNFS